MSRGFLNNFRQKSDNNFLFGWWIEVGSWFLLIFSEHQSEQKDTEIGTWLISFERFQPGSSYLVGWFWLVGEPAQLRRIPDPSQIIIYGPLLIAEF